MSSPVLSPDGKWMWTGSEWIPVPPPESTATVNVQDGVIAGDVIINDSSSSCVSCGSKGVTQIACSNCRKMSHCNICEPEVEEERSEKRLCAECYDDIKNERKRIAEEDERKRIAEEDERKRIAAEISQKEWLAKEIEEKRIAKEIERISEFYLEQLNRFAQKQREIHPEETVLQFFGSVNGSQKPEEIMCVNYSIDEEMENGFRVFTSPEPESKELFLQVRNNQIWKILGFKLILDGEMWEKEYSSGDAKMVSHDLYTIIEKIYDSKNENITTEVLIL